MKAKGVIFLAVLGAVCAVSPFYCLAQETPVDVVDANPEDVAALIEEAKGYIEEGNQEGAEVTLDLAYELAEAIGDYDMLMEIGDLYARVDPSMKDKAIEAWNAAGRCKTQE